MSERQIIAWGRKATRRFKRRMLAAMRALVLSCLLCGCAAAPVAVLPQAPAVGSIFLVPQGGHMGIAVRRADIPAPLWPEKRAFPAADYLEVETLGPFEMLGPGDAALHTEQWMLFNAPGVSAREDEQIATFASLIAPEPGGATPGL